MNRLSIARSFLLTATMLGTIATSAIATPYTFSTYIAVPSDSANVQPGGAFSSFDISFADAMTGDIFVADRSNASVDIFSGSANIFLGRATGFTGQQATSSASGADGVLAVTVAGVTTLYAGDGDSTLKVFNATTPAAPILLQSISTGGSTRVDEMAYSPSAHLVLAANNAETPAYANLFSTTNGGAPAALVAGHITIPTGMGGIAGGGMEQPAWDPNTGTFFVSIPQLAGTGNPGGVAEISTAGTVLRVINFGTMGIASCSPTGLAVGTSGNLMVGCGSAGASAILLNPAGAGSIVKTFSGLAGTDELWFYPTGDEFFVTGNNGSNATRFFDIISDSSDALLQSVLLPVTPSAHSITVDPLNGDVFVPLAGNSTVNPCPVSFANAGCIAVFAQKVPEPGTLPLFAAALFGMWGASMWRRRNAHRR
jgi:hypothetical protein